MVRTGPKSIAVEDLLLDEENPRLEQQCAV